MAANETEIQKEPKILLPGKAYQEAQKHLVYRLSELVFGSLLASYMLGFIGATASLIPEMTKVSGFLNLLPYLAKSLTYILISITFSYTTAGLYISYHVGILTRPTLPLSRMRLDFFIALLQAICFGISLLYPLLLALSLSIVFSTSFWRQKVEYDSLISTLKDQIPRSGDFGRVSKNSGVEIEQIIKEKLSSSALSIWLPPSSKAKVGVFFLFMGGIFLFFSSLIFPSIFSTIKLNIDLFVLVISLLLFVIILKVIFKMLEKKPDLVSEEKIKVLNKELEALIEEIKEHPKASGKKTHAKSDG